MKRHFLGLLGVSFLLFAGNVVAQSTNVYNGSSSVRVVPVTTKQTTTTVVTKPVALDKTTEGSVPSSFQFLVEFCELKEGFYYLPKAKFLELTEQQQNYLLTNKTKFIINDEK